MIQDLKRNALKFCCTDIESKLALHSADILLSPLKPNIELAKSSEMYGKELTQKTTSPIITGGRELKLTPKTLR